VLLGQLVRAALRSGGRSAMMTVFVVVDRVAASQRVETVLEQVNGTVGSAPELSGVVLRKMDMATSHLLRERHKVVSVPAFLGVCLLCRVLRSG
jgi:hypothetical protein